MMICSWLAKRSDFVRWRDGRHWWALGGAGLICVSVVLLLAACGRGRSQPEKPSSQPRIDAARVAPPTGASAVHLRSTTSGSGPVIDFCRDCSAPRFLAELANARLSEASGLAASHLHPNVLYTHNDSGGQPRFYATDLQGNDLGTYELRGAAAIDWEDLAVGPCPAGRCVYLGDTGDNAKLRADYVVYRVAEPAVLSAGRQLVRAEAFPFRYPDKSHDAEALLVHPVTGEMVVITKELIGRSAVYRFPQPVTPGHMITLEKVGVIEPPQPICIITGGDVHPRGSGVLLRTYTALYYVPLTGTDLAAALAGPLCSLPVAFERQGEAVAWTAAGDGYLTLGEGVGRELHMVHCAPP